MDKTIIDSNKAPEPIGPYSQAVFAGNTLYISGQIAIDRLTGEMKNETIQIETEQVMRNLGFILAEAGLGYSNIVKCSIFIKNMHDFANINEEYGKYFKSNPPARETVEVSRLPKDVNVEISCIAVR
ncbi:MAG: RidA family protein [Bacteroidota bacterium]